jgi:hypothetical protein
VSRSKFSPNQDDAKLAADIGAAVTAYDAADTVRKERAIIVGQLLVEAKKRHPGTKAFEKFLETVPLGIGIRRAETFMAIALGRKDFEQHQIENAAAQQKHRDKTKAEKIEKEKVKLALPRPEPAPTELRNARIDANPDVRELTEKVRAKLAGEPNKLTEALRIILAHYIIEDAAAWRRAAKIISPLELNMITDRLKWFRDEYYPKPKRKAA